MTPHLSIASLLDTIVEHLARSNYPIAECLRPGLVQSEVLRHINALPIQLPSEIVEVFMWRNGVERSVQKCLQYALITPDFFLLSLDEAINYYEGFQTASNIDPERYDSNWFPLFANGGGDYYFINCDREAHSIIGYFSHYDELDESPPVLYTSLSMMLATIIRCYQEEAYYVLNGRIEGDLQKEASISQLINSGTKFWTEWIMRYSQPSR